MRNLPRLEWKPNDYNGSLKADIGILLLVVDTEPRLQCAVQWRFDWATEPCESIEEGKAMAVRMAKKLLEQGLATLARKP